jgi:sugar lactone lactonase YvrE
MSRPARVTLAGLTAATALAATIHAATPTFWLVSTQADFLRGEADHVSIDSDGRLMLGPATEVVADTTSPFLWALASAPDGGYWVGSGNEGKVFRVDRSGSLSVYFDSPELEVHALAAAPGGRLYVGTSPDGKVYRVDAGGKSEVVFDPDDKYIWALAVDPEGAVYVATGDKGVIYRIAPDGKASPFYRTRSAHVLTLALDPSGRLVAGTESPGRVLRMDRDGKAFVLLESTFREIRSLRFAPDGTLYAVAVSARPGSSDRPTDRPIEPPTRTVPVPSVSSEITSVSIIEPGSPVDEPPTSRGVDSRRAPRGAIYRILPDGLWDIYWESEDDAPYDVSVEPGGSLLVATGGSGKLFRLEGEPIRPALVARADAQQITSLIRDADGQHLLATSNPGKVVRVSRERARRGSYESDIRDAATVASWGAIRWRAAANGGRVELSTRSGNTAAPDDTWSAWSPAYQTAEGDQITSPKARYLQWRAVLISGAGDRSPVLTSVGAAYLPRNVRPEIVSITVHAPGVVYQRPFTSGDSEIAGFDDRERAEARQQQQSAAPGGGPTPPAPPLGRRLYQKGLQTFVWKAEDGNSDRLQYDVFYRREGETSWRAIKRELTDPIAVWDTTSVPDGTYLVKVVATDAPSNSPGNALLGERESGSFEIDNTAPRIVVQPAAAPARFVFNVEDNHSAIQKVEYSVDGNRWRTVYPKDGIPDSRREVFELPQQDTTGSIIIRASDVMNNVATATAGR